MGEAFLKSVSIYRKRRPSNICGSSKWCLIERLFFILRSNDKFDGQQAVLEA